MLTAWRILYDQDFETVGLTAQRVGMKQLHSTALPIQLPAPPPLLLELPTSPAASILAVPFAAPMEGLPLALPAHEALPPLMAPLESEFHRVPTPAPAAITPELVTAAPLPVPGVAPIEAPIKAPVVAPALPPAMAPMFAPAAAPPTEAAAAVAPAPAEVIPAGATVC